MNESLLIIGSKRFESEMIDFYQSFLPQIKENNIECVIATDKDNLDDILNRYYDFIYVYDKYYYLSSDIILALDKYKEEFPYAIFIYKSPRLIIGDQYLQDQFESWTDFAYNIIYTLQMNLKLYNIFIDEKTNKFNQKRINQFMNSLVNKIAECDIFPTELIK